MTSGPPPGFVPPKPRLLRVTGTLSLVFACLLLGTGALEGAWLVAMPAFTSLMNAGVREQAARERDQHRREIEDLKARETAATTETEKTALAAQRARLESALGDEPPDLDAMFGLSRDPRVLGHDLAKISTGLVLNGLLLAVGVGLLRGKESARRLGLWVAGLKLARLAALGVLAVMVIIPIKAQANREMWARMMRSTPPTIQGPGGAQQSAVEMARLTAVSAMAQATLFLVLGSAWPIAMLVLLTRPGARAACLAPVSTGTPTPPEPDLP